MNKKEFSEIISLIQIAYNKQYLKEEIEVMYDLLKDFEYNTLKVAIKRLIATSRYVPNVSQIISEYKQIKRDEGYNKILKARELGNIKTNEELDKAMKWLDKGIVPDWLDKDLQETPMSETELENLQKEFEEILNN